MNIRNFVSIAILLMVFESGFANSASNLSGEVSIPTINANALCPVLKGGLISLSITSIFEGKSPGKIINAQSPSGGDGNLV